MTRRIVCEAGWLGSLVQVVINVRDGSHRPTRFDRCRRTATHRFSAGCVHEHLETWRVCAWCALALMEQWRRTRREPGKENAARCIACRRIDGHICQVLASAEEGLALDVAVAP